MHGSAPDIAGKGIANPIATIASFAMRLRYSFDQGATADRIEAAIASVLDQGYRTADIKQDGCRTVCTAEMGKAILAALDSWQSRAKRWTPHSAPTILRRPSKRPQRRS